MKAVTLLTVASVACLGSGIGTAINARPAAGFVWAVLLYVAALCVVADSQKVGRR